MGIFDLAIGLPWAITEPALRQVLSIAARESVDVELAQLMRADRAARPSALAARGAPLLEGAKRARIRDGVAIIEVVGPIVRRADLFSDISGATSVEALSTDLNVALAAPSVTAILFAIDSPGGEVTGINEFAQMIYAARRQKRIWSYVEGMGASAAYWIASATERILLDPTAGVGSIGVVMAVPDPAKRTAKDIEIVSSQSPRKRPDVSSPDGRSQLQALVDDIAGVFVATVARNRNVAEAVVLRDFGQGGMLIGKGAVRAGLADELGSFERALSAIGRPGTTAPSPARGALAPAVTGSASTTLRRTAASTVMASVAAPTTRGVLADERALPARGVLPAVLVTPRQRPPDTRTIEERIQAAEQELRALQRGLPMSAVRRRQLLGMTALGTQALQLAERHDAIERTAAAASGLTVERRRALLGATDMGQQMLAAEWRKAYDDTH